MTSTLSKRVRRVIAPCGKWKRWRLLGADDTLMASGIARDRATAERQAAAAKRRHEK